MSACTSFVTSRACSDGDRGTPQTPSMASAPWFQRLEHWVPRPLRGRIGVAPADYQSMDVIKGILHHREGNPSAHGIAKEMGTGNVEISEDGDDVGDIGCRHIGLRLMR